MLVLIDTSIWSLAFRRPAKNLSVEEALIRTELEELIREARAQLPGPVRQELLSGLRDERQYEGLRKDLRAFDNPVIDTADYEEAGRVNNRCRSHGVSGSAVDFLICAIALRRDWSVFTTDKDFFRYAKYLPLKLHEIRHKT